MLDVHGSVARGLLRCGSAHGAACGWRLRPIDGLASRADSEADRWAERVRRPGGKPQLAVAVQMLRTLIKRGVLSLVGRAPPDGARSPRPAPPQSEPLTLPRLEGSLAELGPMELVAVRSRWSRDYRVWRELLQAHHSPDGTILSCALCRALDVQPPCPDSMLAALASLPIPDALETKAPTSPLYQDPLQETMLACHGIEVPIIPWPAPPKRLLRVSAQRYNRLEDYHRLARALSRELSRIPV